jgi:hypothetical protein
MSWLWFGYGKRFESVPCADARDWECKVKELKDSDEIVDICAQNSYSMALTSRIDDFKF